MDAYGVRLDRSKVEALVAEFCERFSREARGSDNWKRWTELVLKNWARLGDEEDYKSNSRLFRADGGGEYIVDLCWYQQDDMKYRGLVMVLESEWATGRFATPQQIRGMDKQRRLNLILEDFYKVLDLKSPWKVLGYHTYSDEHHDEFLQAMVRTIEDHNNCFAGEIYTFMDFAHREKPSPHWRIFVDTYLVGNDGRGSLTRTQEKVIED